MTLEEKQDWIDRYLRQQLNSEELLQFQNFIAGDSDWETMLESQREVHQAVNRFYLKEQLNAIHKKMPKQKDKSPRGKLIKMAFLITSAAAAILVIAMIYNRSNQHHKLFNDYFYKDAGLPVVMSVDKNRLNESMNLYKQNRFEEAGTAFQALLQQEPQNDTLLYYVGMCALNQDKFSTAKEYLQQIEGETFASNANYFLALIAIKQKDWETAKKHLNQSNHPKAKSLLEKINE